MGNRNDGSRGILDTVHGFSYDSRHPHRRKAAASPSSVRTKEALMVKKSVLAIALLAVLCVAAYAVEAPPFKQDSTLDKWEFYETDEDGASYLYNASTVEHLKGGLIRVWVQAIYTDKNPKFREGRFLWEVDCSKKRMRGLTAYVTKKDGIKETITQSSDWSPIPADSTAETLHGLVCKKKEKKAAAAPAH